MPKVAAKIPQALKGRPKGGDFARIAYNFTFQTLFRRKQMPPFPSSQIFEQLAWNNEFPQWPILNGVYRGLHEKEIEVSLIGELQSDWPDFLQKSEASWRLILAHEARMLTDAAPEIHRQHRAYFGDRWEGTPENLLSQLSLRLVCFYTNGSVNLWYSGTAAFNHLDVDLGLDPDLRVTEVRFDG